MSSGPATRTLRPHRRGFARLRRRIISVPLVMLSHMMWVLTAPLWLPLCLTVDLITAGLAERPRLRAMSFFGLFLTCEVLGIIAATALWLLTLGGRLGGQTRFIAGNAALQRVWSQTLFRGSFFLFSMKLEVSGIEHAEMGPYLLFVRHSSSADTVLAAGLVANPQRRLLRYVLKRELLWDPCLDIVGCRLPNVFVDRKASDPAAEISEVAQLCHGLDARSGVLIYPEGTRFTKKKLARSQAKLREKGWDELAELAEGFESILPPRLAGPLALIEAGPELDIVILEHAGFEGAATFHRFWTGQLIGRTVIVRLRRIPVSEIPAEGREQWLFKVWAETDRWVSSVSPLTYRDPQLSENH